jgi:hypothetical protein
METPKNLLLIRGYGALHPDRWQEYEKKHAEEQGLRVFYPQDVPNFVPNPSPPLVQDFGEFVADIFREEGLEPDKTVVLAHSLAGNGWLRLLETRKDLQACLTRIIATPKSNPGLEAIKDFFPTPDLAEISTEARARISVIGSDNDGEIHELPSVLGAHLSVPSITIPGAGHFMPRALHHKDDEMDLGGQWMEVRGRIHNLNLPY